jgi:hypothetical protein
VSMSVTARAATVHTEASVRERLYRDSVPVVCVRGWVGDLCVGVLVLGVGCVRVCVDVVVMCICVRVGVSVYVVSFVCVVGACTWAFIPSSSPMPEMQTSQVVEPANKC